MKNLNFWSTAVLLAILLCLETVTGETKRKKYEVGSLPIDGHFCGDQIKEVYSNVCLTRKRKRSTTINEKEALSFLRSSWSARNTGTDIVEECCKEGCAWEEIFEYCM